MALEGGALVSVVGDVEWECKDVSAGSPMAYKTGIVSFP